MSETDELSQEVKTFIVQALACYDPPSVVCVAVKEEFGLALDRRRVHRYDPTKKAGDDLGAALKVIFDETRKAFLEETATIGIANKAVRLRMLDRIATKAAAQNNGVLVMQACEAAAKEVGDVHTNKHKHEHTGKDGKDLPAAGAQVVIYQLPDNGRG